VDRRPALATVVEDDGQDRGQTAVGQYLTPLDQVLIEQPDVDHHAQRHVLVDAALEFDEQVQIHPLTADLDPPDDVVSPVAKIFADVAAGHPLQGAVVKAMQPLVRHEAENQVAHQFRRGEEEFVAGVVSVCHRRMVAANQEVLGAVPIQRTDQGLEVWPAWPVGCTLPSATRQGGFGHAFDQTIQLVAIGVCMGLEAEDTFRNKGRPAGREAVDFIVETSTLSQKGGGSREADRTLFAVADGTHDSPRYRDC
jgi:hypothetical protein